MARSPLIQMEEIREADFYDFTPDSQRVWARSVKAQVGSVRATLSEIDKDDPSIIHVALYAGRSMARNPGDVFLEGNITTQQLDDMICVLVAVRDTRISRRHDRARTVRGKHRLAPSLRRGKAKGQQTV